MRKEINPIPFIVAAAVLIVGLVYFVAVRPSMEEAKVAREWATPEAASKRGPGKEKSEDYEAKVRELRQKENAATTLTRRRDRD